MVNYIKQLDIEYQVVIYVFLISVILKFVEFLYKKFRRAEINVNIVQDWEEFSLFRFLKESRIDVDFEIDTKYWSSGHVAINRHINSIEFEFLCFVLTFKFER